MSFESGHSELMEPVLHSSSEHPHKQHKFETWRIIGGTISIVVALLSMVAMSEALQLIESNYSKPFFLRWIVTSGYIFAIIEYYIVKYLNNRSKKSNNMIEIQENYEQASVMDNDNDNDNENDNSNSYDNESNYDNKFDQESRESKNITSDRTSDRTSSSRSLSKNINNKKGKSFFKKCKIFFIPSIILNINDIWGGYLWYLSLEGTSVSVNNTIYQSQAAFAYIGSVLFLGSQVKK